MKKSSTASLATALLLLTACTHGNQQISTIPPEEQLANSVIAYSMSTDYRSAGGLENNPGGSILFYNPDTRTWTDIATDGIEHSTLTYRDQTLYCADYHTDYALTPKGLATTEHQDHQVPRIPLMFSIPQDRGGGMVALANQGMEDDGSGYLWDVIVTQGNKRTVHPLGHYVGYAAQCEDGSVWGWTDPYLTSNTSDYGPANAPQQILQLYPDFKPDPVATITQDRMVTAGTELNCYNNVLYYIIDNYKPEITDPVGGGPVTMTAPRWFHMTPRPAQLNNATSPATGLLEQPRRCGVGLRWKNIRIKAVSTGYSSTVTLCAPTLQPPTTRYSSP